MAAAFILFFVWPVDMDNYRIITITVVPVLIAGCVMFFGSLLRRSSESEIDEEVLKMLQGFEEKARFELDVYEKELPYVSSLVTEGYHYFDTPYIKRDGQGEYRTDHYVKTLVYFTKDELRASTRTAHLAEEGVDDELFFVPYKDITEAKLEKKSREYQKGKKTLVIPFYELNVYGRDGVLFGCQTKYNYAVECAVEDINKLAEKFRG